MSDIFNELSKLPTIKDVFEYINDKYPNWILNISDKYSSDYPQLQNNWKMMAEQVSKTQMQKIIIVDNFSNDEYLTIAELLTKVGFIIRTKNDLITCKICNSAIPSLETYNKMKQNNVLVWKDYCTDCKL